MTPWLQFLRRPVWDLRVRYSINLGEGIFTNRGVNREGSVHQSVRLFPLRLLNRLTFELLFVYPLHEIENDGYSQNQPNQGSWLGRVLTTQRTRTQLKFAVAATNDSALGSDDIKSVKMRSDKVK